MKKALLSSLMAIESAQLAKAFKDKSCTLRTSKGGKPAVTAAQQKRAKIKRRNKAK